MCTYKQLIVDMLSVLHCDFSVCDGHWCKLYWQCHRVYLILKNKLSLFSLCCELWYYRVFLYYLYSGVTMSYWYQTGHGINLQIYKKRSSGHFLIITFLTESRRKNCPRTALLITYKHELSWVTITFTIMFYLKS